MYTYNRPYYTALVNFKDKYLYLVIGTVISIIGITILLKTNNFDDVVYIYLYSSIIITSFIFSYMYWIGYKNIEKFMINISNTELIIGENILSPHEINDVYTTSNNDLVIIADNKGYKIYKSLEKYDELIDLLKKSVQIKSKKTSLDNTLYIIDFSLFIIFMIIRIPYIVIPIGIYLMYSNSKDLYKNIINNKNINIFALLIKFVILGIIGYKLVLFLRFVI